MDFGNLEIVKKTFVRKSGAVRGQEYKGIKFRRFKSKRKGKEGEIFEQFTISEHLWKALELDKYALAHANAPTGEVILLVVDDQDETKPVAKFCRKSIGKDGVAKEKGKSFGNPFIVEGLLKNGVLKPDTLDNQFLTVKNVADQFANPPSVVHAIVAIVPDDTVEESEEEKQEEMSKETDFN
jgi:hypothetical protein